MDKINNNKIKNITLFTLAFIMFASVFCFFINFDKIKINTAEAQYQQQVIELANNVQFSADIENFYSTDTSNPTVVYNFVVPVRFSDETDIMNVTNDKYSKTNYEVLQEMYNTGKYSVNSYYKTVSNGRLDLKTVILLDNNKALQLSMTRASMGNKNYNNGVGYDPNASVRVNYSGVNYQVYYSNIYEYQMLDQICGFALDTIESSYNLVCDSNNDGNIDSLSIPIQPDQGTVTRIEWSDLLWAHSNVVQILPIQVMGTNYGVDIDNFRFTNSNNKQIYFGSYMMSHYNYEDSDNICTVSGLPKNNTDIHELGHVLGFPDYYVYEGNFANTVSDDAQSVAVWDIMGYSHLNLPQYPLTYNRYKQNWVDDKNIVKIQGNGVYSLLPVNYEEVNGTSLGDRTLAYKIVSKQYPDQAIYLEYRTQTANSFENNRGYLGNGLLIYRVDEGFAPAQNYSRMLSAGNFAATPYNVYVFRNDLSGKSNMYDCQFGAALNKENASMGKGESHTVNGYTTTSCNLTWQVYESGKTQDAYLASEVTEVDSGISVEFVSIDETTGLLTFKVSGLEDLPIKKSSFGDEKLYYKLLELAGKTTSQDLFASDLDFLTELDLHNLSLTSIKGIELFDFENLSVVDLSLNNLTDYTELLNFANKKSSVKINVAFNNYNISSLPQSLKTDKIIIGFQNVNLLNNTVLYYGKDDVLYKVDFYANNYEDVSFNVVESSTNKYQLQLGKNTLEMNLITSQFKHKISVDIYVVRAYLSQNNLIIERNDQWPVLIIEGLDQSYFTVTQTPNLVDTSIATSSYFTVTWEIVFNNNTTQTHNLSYSFKIVDTVKPIITINGSNRIELVKGTTLNLPNPEIQISDNGEICNFEFLQNPTSSDTGYWSKKYYKLTQNGQEEISNVDINSYATYTIEYIACDNYGNISQVYVRTVEVTPTPLTRNDIPDENLYNAICALSGKLQVYENSLESLDIINFENKQISSIKGLELLNFKNNAIINLNYNNISSVNEVNIFTNDTTNIMFVSLHCNYFTDYNNSNFENENKLSLGLQGITFGKFVKNGNVGENLQFVFYGKDNYFNYSQTSYIPIEGQNTITTYGKYDFVFDFINDIPSINGQIEFGAIEFTQPKQELEVYDDLILNVNYSYFTENTFEINYYIDNNQVVSSQIALINQTLGEKVLKYEYKYDNKIICVIEKIFVVQDTTSPTISFENNNDIYLKKGQTFNPVQDVEITVNDNYNSENELEIIYTGNYQDNTSGKFECNFQVKDKNNNISQTITKTVYVGDIEAKENLVFEYNQSYNIQDLVEFEYFNINDFVIENSGDINTNVLSTQTVSYTFTHKKANYLIFDIVVSVIVKDTIAPEIVLNGKSEIDIYVNANFTEPGWTATDNYDGIITEKVVKQEKINTNAAGTYRISYFVTDSNGNKSQTVYRTINVRYLPMPKFTLKTDLQAESYSAGSFIKMYISLAGIDTKKYNTNSSFSWYIDDKCVHTGTEKSFTYQFEDAGEHTVVVKVQNVLINGETSITESEQFKVLIVGKGFIEKYGLIIIIGGACLLTGVVVLSFVISIKRRKRKFYY